MFKILEYNIFKKIKKLSCYKWLFLLVKFCLLKTQFAMKSVKWIVHKLLFYKENYGKILA